MIVIENPNGRMNAGERAFVAAQRGRQGIALVNFMVGGGGPRKPGREIDVILLLPRGIVAVEVKYTSAVGDLASPTNDLWTVGTVEQPFSSRCKSPAAQADQATKILASALTSSQWPKAYITPAVAIHGPVRIREQVRWVGTVGVATVEHFDLLLDQARTRRIEARHVGPMLDRLGVGVANIPDLDRLVAEGFAPDAAESLPEVAEPVRIADQRATRPRRTGRRRLLGLTMLAALSGAWLTPTSRWSLPPSPITHLTVAVGLGLVLLLAQWMRFKVSTVGPIEAGGYLLTVVAVFLVASSWTGQAAAVGVLNAFMGYAVGWPLAAMLARECAEPVLRTLDRLRREYEF